MANVTRPKGFETDLTALQAVTEPSLDMSVACP